MQGGWGGPIRNDMATMCIWPKKILLCRIKFNLNLISLEKVIAKDASFRWLAGRWMLLLYTEYSTYNIHAPMAEKVDTVNA